MHTRNRRRDSARRAPGAAHGVRLGIAGWTGAAMLAAGPAQASFLSGDALDTMADVISWLVLILVPIIAITIFWIVHVMPEKIAHKRHHPQRDAIQTLCLLSLVFGGLMWPFAWLWAYTRPVGYRLAFGTDKHEDFFVEQAARAREGAMSAAERAALVAELDAMQARGTLPPHLAQLRAELAAPSAPTAAPKAQGAA